ncbi:hypothetical protein QN372_11025 [Undibacterium sp. RTI2.1]|uniref:hypothetical protein n=1 Tax=unclassified Undibacterium TaxID=2630295 RepID=UPI002AB377C7|nr:MULTISPECIES: hypothetical protein [unclassified Undibacterium]MDY7538593.1 hypothetical protein [Undibacterium sp. 5I1]MEB0031282.1 hypothetical protein [Undibacterium sp. RTI2.1]MEB0116326.1 hypothetical protein [Undibacterium sp. RTI2.2]MEB0231436.1 hypothetical protein [Undibacterium sp. 10I3]MEB0258095.1 hypothetical protein [Undibacterium sp. 5I1]
MKSNKNTITRIISSKIAPALIVSLFAMPVFAQTAATTNTPNIDKRQDNQQQRVANGVSSGALTAKEATNLEKRESKIETDKQAAKADGTVTKQERAKLQHEENRASKKIYAKKHNARTASSPGQ